MRPDPEVLDALACLLTYPGESGASERYAGAVRVVTDVFPGAHAPLSAFRQGVAALEQGEIEELYTRTFDNVAARSLEVGWQLFGENYARGVLMVRYRALMREHGVPEGTELPDHLTHVLGLLGRLPESLAGATWRQQVKPALEKMRAGLEAFGSPWAGVLEAVDTVLGSGEPGPVSRTEVRR